MDTPKTLKRCQITAVPRIALPIRTMSSFHYWKSRIKRFLKRRLTYARNLVLEISKKNSPNISNTLDVSVGVDQLQVDSIVRVRSAKDIRATLDRWNRLKGCTFLEEMLPYCETTHRVMKRVERFLDERDYRVKGAKGIILLHGVICTGSFDFGRCDRSCFFFWREEWLEKIG